MFAIKGLQMEQEMLQREQKTLQRENKRLKQTLDNIKVLWGTNCYLLWHIMVFNWRVWPCMVDRVWHCMALFVALRF